MAEFSPMLKFLTEPANHDATLLNNWQSQRFVDQIKILNDEYYIKVEIHKVWFAVWKNWSVKITLIGLHVFYYQ